MNVAQIAGLAVSFSIFLVVLSLGLRTSLSDATFLFRQPKLLLRSIVSMNSATAEWRDAAPRRKAGLQ